MFAGLIQSLFFCFLKFYEMWSIKAGGDSTAAGAVAPAVPNHGTTSDPARAGWLGTIGAFIMRRQGSITQNACVICLTESAKMAIVPCGHKCLCEGCANTSSIQTCPMCRGQVLSFLRVFG